MAVFAGQYIEPMPAGSALLLPSQCEVCRGWDAGLLCAGCRARHAPLRARCQRCGLALAISSPSCGECQRDPPPYARTVVALDYGFPWDRLIAAFKFERRVELAAPLAALLDAAIDAAAKTLSTPMASSTLVVPVPLSPARLAERGFNQAWELARRLARRRRLHAAPEALMRVIDTAAQATLDREERRRNLRNAFAPAPPPLSTTRFGWRAPLQPTPAGPPAARPTTLHGLDVALVDDVMTTSATAREAAAALLRGGARSVQLWVLARTPAPG